MIEVYKTYKHNPPHLFIPNSQYFITGSTYLKKKYLKDDKTKEHLLDSFKKAFEEYNWILEDWVILDNHYHIMIGNLNNADSLSKMMNEVHRFTALWIKKNSLDFRNEKRIFYNYWDSCINYKRSYLTRINYIYYNPIKHSYVDRSEDYKWCSFRYRLDKENEYLKILREKYPCDKVKIEDNY